MPFPRITARRAPPIFLNVLGLAWIAWVFMQSQKDSAELRRIVANAELGSALLRCKSWRVGADSGTYVVELTGFYGDVDTIVKRHSLQSVSGDIAEDCIEWVARYTEKAIAQNDAGQVFYMRERETRVLVVLKSHNADAPDVIYLISR